MWIRNIFKTADLNQKSGTKSIADRIFSKILPEQNQKALKILKVLKIVMYISLLIFPLFCLLIVEYMNSSGDLFATIYWVRTFRLSAIFGILVFLIIFSLLLLLLRKAVIAAGILGFFSLLFGYINYVKVALNGDNFFPRDIVMIGNAEGLISFISGSVPGYFWLGLATTILWVAAYGVFNTELPLNWKIRIPIAASIVTIVLFTFSSNQRIENILYKFDMNLFEGSLQNQNYQENGFVGAFALNILAMNAEKPENYSRDTIMALLESFEHTPTNGEDFDVIVVLSESFFDARILPDVEFSENPLPNFDEITSRANAFSGLVYTTAISGGTVRPEFDTLTGLTTDFLPSGAIPYEFTMSPTETYVSNYRDSGYRTMALHPYMYQFYSRHLAYPFLGFDRFLAEQHLSDMFEFERSRGYVSDASLLNPIKHFFDEAEADDVPLFMFVITMQNHQPFNPIPESDVRIEVTSNVLTDDELSPVITYTQGLADADRMLGSLADFIDNRERPTVMLFFGDHLPNLGGNFTAFTQTGLFDGDALWTYENRVLMYSTPFIIYSNRELRPFLPNDGNHISTYYLLSALAYMTDFHRTPYMNLLLDHFQRVPFYNVRLNQAYSPDIDSLSNMKRLITYDRLLGQGYSVIPREYSE